MSKPFPIKRKILKTLVNEGEKEAYTKLLLEHAKNRESTYVCFCNVHMLIEAYDNSYFEKVVNSATYTFPDGAPVAKSLSWKYRVPQKRIAGMDYLPYFLGICNEYCLNVAFIGASEETLKKLREKIYKEFPQIKLTCTISPPFSKPWDNNSYIKEFNETKTQVVFVALGCPKQEKWMYENHTKINAVLLGIGGALPVFTGDIKRAPKIMIRLSLEWLYRLLQEPKRMFKRYFYTNSKFLWLIFKQKTSP